MVKTMVSGFDFPKKINPLTWEFIDWFVSWFINHNNPPIFTINNKKSVCYIYHITIVYYIYHITIEFSHLKFSAFLTAATTNGPGEDLNRFLFSSSAWHRLERAQMVPGRGVGSSLPGPVNIQKAIENGHL
jgi:hypothetical protein